MPLRKRFVELLIYCGIGVVVVAATLFYAEISDPASRPDVRWLGFAFFTALTFGYPIYWYYQRRLHRARFWAVLALLLAVHLGCFVAVLLLVESWPLIMFAVIMPIEWYFMLPILERAGKRGSGRRIFS